MQQLPQIVKVRLQQTARSEHPDADALTAFAERSLPNLERSVVMEHLARCGECREVLALALPEIEEVVMPALVRRPWLSMPALRWGAIAASLIVVLSVGIVRYRQGRGTAPRTAALMQGRRELTVNNRQPAVHTTDAQVPANAVATSALRNTIARTDAKKDRKTNSGGSIRNADGGPRLARPLPLPGVNALNSAPGLSAAGASVFAQGAQPSSPMPAQTTVEVASASALVQTEQSQLEVQQSLPGQSPEDHAVVARAKAPVPQSMGALTAAPIPRWTITSAGGLQRSYDQGKTWQDIPIAAASGPASAALQAELSAGYARHATLSKKQSSNPSPLIRAISASGLEIWAGAAGGVLYHSVDGGDHWTSAILSEAGNLLTGDIVSIDFPDSVHGKLVTSTLETWITADGGQHWSRQ